MVADIQAATMANSIHHLHSRAAATDRQVQATAVQAVRHLLDGIELERHAAIQNAESKAAVAGIMFHLQKIVRGSSIVMEYLDLFVLTTCTGGLLRGLAAA